MMDLKGNVAEMRLFVRTVNASGESTDAMVKKIALMVPTNPQIAVCVFNVLFFVLTRSAHVLSSHEYKLLGELLWIMIHDLSPVISTAYKQTSSPKAAWPFFV